MPRTAATQGAGHFLAGGHREGPECTALIVSEEASSFSLPVYVFMKCGPPPAHNEAAAHSLPAKDEESSFPWMDPLLVELVKEKQDALDLLLKLSELKPWIKSLAE